MHSKFEVSSCRRSPNALSASSSSTERGSICYRMDGIMRTWSASRIQAAGLQDLHEITWPLVIAHANAPH